GQVPGVDQVVGEQLPDVLAARGVTERQVHGAGQRPGCGHRGDRLCCGLLVGPGRVGPEQVAVEPVTYLRDGPPGQQQWGPAVLTDYVVDPGTHVPVGARGGRPPLVGAHGRNPAAELLA